MNHLFTIRVPLFWTVVAVSITAILSYYLLDAFAMKPQNVMVTSTASSSGCSEITFHRNHHYELIHPLLFSEISIEDDSLQSLKTQISGFINTEKTAGRIQNASVYFRRMDTQSWFGINQNEEYILASLFKVPVMIGILMDADRDPGFLNKGVFYKEYPKEVFNQNVPPLPGGHVYSIKVLLESMISRSDNNAYDLLWKNMNKAHFDQLLVDLQLKPFNVTDTGEYRLNAESYSKLFRVLYNAGYLSPKNSEFALKLLSKSDFQEGLITHIDKNVTVARKFGYRVNSTEGDLSEFGIFYVNDHPYLLGVMTRGLEYKNLNTILSTVSSMVYQRMKNLPSS
ncbi:MAG TPA: class A beta-lactamase-related serine hydrolase [Bacteroidia bacterium]|nr:class A beta-lactamase-related serine hydrolase [Bacteroidia bacterium]